MPCGKKAHNEIMSAIRKEYPHKNLDQRRYITNAIIYGKHKK